MLVAQRIVVAGYFAIFSVLSMDAQEPADSVVPGLSKLQPAQPLREDHQSNQADEKRISVNFKATPIVDALDEVARASGVTIKYVRRMFDAGATVTLEARNAKTVDVVTALLRGTGVRVESGAAGSLKLMRHGRTPIDGTQKTGVISGIVVDSSTGNGIAKATVTAQPGSRTVLTNEKGAYVFPGIPYGEYTVSVKIFGFKAMSRTVVVAEGGGKHFVFALIPVTTQLSGVVTTATGEQRKVEVGNDITTIDVAAVIEKNPISSVTDLLATRVPGLIVGRASGEPGAKSEIRIRGTNSLRASMEPIVIVDGVQVIGDRAGVDTTGFSTSPLDQLDVNSISKIEVLKGPSAVALYGSNAANGVIVVTTKRGQEGPARWDVAATVSQETMPGTWPLNYFAWGEDLTNGKGTVHCPRYDVAKATATQKLNWGVFPTCRYDSTTVYQILNDPQTTVFGKGIRKDVSMSVRGGTRQITYSVIGTYRPTLGLLKLPDADVRLLEDAGISLKSWQRRPQALDQYSGTAAIRLAINDQSDLTYTTRVIREDKRSTPLVDMLGKAKELTPPIVLYDQDGVPVGGGSGVLVGVPRFMAGRNSNSFRFVNTANYRATFWKTLTVETTAGIDASNGRETYLLATGDYCPLRGSLNLAFGSCSVQDSTEKNYTSVRSSQLMTDAHFRVSGTPKGFRLLNVTPVVGIDVNSNMTGMTGVAAGLLPVGGRGIRGAGLTWVGPEVQAARQTAGMFAQTTVAIANRLWLPFSVRTDAGNAIGSSSKPIFPRVALSYLVSDEPNFRNLPVLGRLPELRLRTAFGAAGRQPGLVDKHRTYTFSRFPIENVNASIVNLNSVGNTKLSPEISREWELGFDAVVVERSRGRLSGTVTLSQSHTTDLIMEENLPPSLGMITRRVNNIGDAENSNLEVTIEGFQRMGLFDWNTLNGFSMGKGKLISLKNPLNTGIGEGNRDNFSSAVYRAGYPIDGYWARPVLGFIDGDDDGQIQYNEVMYGDRLQYLGTPTPRFTLTSNNTITVASRVTITATVMYEGGSTAMSRSASAASFKYAQDMNDPTVSLEDQVKSRYDFSAYTHQVSTLRFQSMQLTYNVPLSQRSHILGMRSLQVAVSGTNLGLWSTFSGKDPGVGGIGREATQSVLPTPRTYGIAVRVQ